MPPAPIDMRANEEKRRARWDGFADSQISRNGLQRGGLTDENMAVDHSKVMPCKKKKIVTNLLPATLGNKSSNNESMCAYKKAGDCSERNDAKATQERIRKESPYDGHEM